MIRLAIKDLRLFMSDRRAILLCFVVPIALVTLFAFAFGAVGQKKGEARPTTLIIADDDNSVSSKNVIAQLDSLLAYDVYLTSKDSARYMVKKGEEAAVLVFHQGFGDSMDAGNTLPITFEFDASKEAEVAMLQGSLTGSLMGIVGNKSMIKDAIGRFDNDSPDLDDVSRRRIHEQIKRNFSSGETKKQSESFIRSVPLIAEKQHSPRLIHAVAGTSVMMLLFSVVGMGVSLLDEREQGTLKKLLYSPLRSDTILFGKMLYVNMISVMQLVVMFLFARFAFGLDIFSHVPSLMLMIIVTSFACSSFGVLLASVAKSRQQVQAFSTLIVMVMSCIGGSMVPSFAMPSFMQKMSVFSVNYWSIQGFYDIFWRMLPLQDSTFLSRVLVLFLIGGVLNMIALFVFRKNILKIA